MTAPHTELSETTVQGFRALTLASDSISCTIVPELGGKLSSLLDLRTGREWLWTNPDLQYRSHGPQASYIREADTGGWDECFPTIAPCAYPRAPYEGLPLPDHGEVWSQAWDVQVVNVGERTEIRGRAQGRLLPYTFERTLSLGPAADTMRLHYSVKNTSNDPLVFIWSAHPIFALEPGMRVQLPTGARLHRYLAVPPNALPATTVTWPARVATNSGEVYLDPLPGPEAGVAFKLWSDPLDEGWATLTASDGALQFQFDHRLVPQVGLWLNAGGWSGTEGPPYYNLALEPCIGAQDSLQDAVEQHERYAALAPGEEREWWIQVRLSSSTGADK